VEHPEVVARRLEEAVGVVGDRERVIASTDCGLGTFTNREWVIEPSVWLKLKTLREGADLVSKRLFGSVKRSVPSMIFPRRGDSRKTGFPCLTQSLRRSGQ
jgi:hypothetical protein